MHRVRDFTGEHLSGAADLLAARHRECIRLEPALAPEYSDPATTVSFVESLLRADGAHGVVAESGDRMVGFLLGRAQFGEVFGRGGWVDLEAHASTDPVVTVDLYTAWAAHWVARGAFHHYVTVPFAPREQLDTWYQLGFGQMHAYAVRETDPSDLAADPTIVIRRAEAGDADFIAAVANVINATQLASPSFAPVTPEQHDRTIGEHLDELDHGEDPWWVAVDQAGDQPIGLTMFYEADPGLGTPVGAVYLAGTMAAPAARRRGIGRQLLRHVLTTAADRGVTHCVTNWRTSNPAAARTWPALGFRPTHVRLLRRVDERIAWARGPVRGTKI